MSAGAPAWHAAERVAAGEPFVREVAMAKNVTVTASDADGRAAGPRYEIIAKTMGF